MSRSSSFGGKAHKHTRWKGLITDFHSHRGPVTLRSSTGNIYITFEPRQRAEVPLIVSLIGSWSNVCAVGITRQYATMGRFECFGNWFPQGFFWSLGGQEMTEAVKLRTLLGDMHVSCIFTSSGARLVVVSLLKNVQYDTILTYPPGRRWICFTSIIFKPFRK